MGSSKSKPKFPDPVGWDDFDRDMTGQPAENGAPGTYNHLTDAVLDVPFTREMYLRRCEASTMEIALTFALVLPATPALTLMLHNVYIMILCVVHGHEGISQSSCVPFVFVYNLFSTHPHGRLRTLADDFLAGGRLRQIIDAQYAAVQQLALEDDALWDKGAITNIDRGYQQLTTEWLPRRTEQLLGDLYGPNGEHPLLPEKQQDKPRIAVGKVRRWPVVPTSVHLNYDGVFFIVMITYTH